MKIFINVKQVGKRKKIIEHEVIQLDFVPTTLRELIERIVVLNVNKFNNSRDQNNIVTYLLTEEIESKMKTGKVGFGNIYNETKAKVDEAITNALQSYEDGIFRVFIGDDEVIGLSQWIELHEEDELTFIRLTMLAGRLW